MTIIRPMLPVIELSTPAGKTKLDALLGRLRLDPLSLIDPASELQKKAAIVGGIIQRIAREGDAGLVAITREFDEPDFQAAQLVVTPEEMAAAHASVSPVLLAALRRSIAQVREYQRFILPAVLPELTRATDSAAAAVSLGLRWTPLDSVGLYIPGGKASYPSSLIMLAVPALVAGVRRIAVVTPPGKYFSPLLLAAAHELGITEIYRAGGPAAIAALAVGTATIRPVDKILGPGSTMVQLAKRALAGSVGIDGYFGPSEIVTLADDSADAAAVAADLIAQAEHDPGSCFLVTPSRALADKVLNEIKAVLPKRERRAAIEKALTEHSAILLAPDARVAIETVNALAAEHLSLQLANPTAALAHIRHAGAIFIGPFSPVAAGDYVAGPSHALPTNTTARFSSGVSVYEFLKRTSIVQYTAAGLHADAPHIAALATSEQLDAHAASATAGTRDNSTPK